MIDIQKDGTALVVDPFLLYMKQAPKTAKFFKEDAKRMRVRWRIDDMKYARGHTSDTDFSLVFDKRRNKASITINISNASNTDNGTGSCALQAS
ncbi:hypothetical protein [Shimia abyssi]|uniref:Uncharacterized protein n=1 Tax=Shimia abyssi TaxID=1662395 RepID=A0A2P8FJ12_9RHOB|nr:hypothetical protein [Shimia abyssi]PSL21695.1 hypothetical protein CLV88_101119 [Shimia abyssi]